MNYRSIFFHRNFIGMSMMDCSFLAFFVFRPYSWSAFTRIQFDVFFTSILLLLSKQLELAWENRRILSLEV